MVGRSSLVLLWDANGHPHFRSDFLPFFVDCRRDRRFEDLTLAHRRSWRSTHTLLFFKACTKRREINIWKKRNLNLHVLQPPAGKRSILGFLSRQGQPLYAFLHLRPYPRSATYLRTPCGVALPQNTPPQKQNNGTVVQSEGLLRMYLPWIGRPWTAWTHPALPPAGVPIKRAGQARAPPLPAQTGTPGTSSGAPPAKPEPPKIGKTNAQRCRARHATIFDRRHTQLQRAQL